MYAGRMVAAVASTGAVLVAVPSAAAATQAEWHVVKSVEPKYSKGFSDFDRVLAVGAAEAWVFGAGDGAEFAEEPTNDMLAYRFDGRTWRHTKLPGRLGNLWGPVVETGPSAVYAMARFQLPEAPSPPRKAHYSSTLVRWNGTRWTAMKGWKGYHLQAMAVLGPKNIWAFGSRVQNGRLVPVSVHYDGGKWTASTAPYLVEAVVKGPKGRLFATGYKPDGSLYGSGTARALRFDGKRWRQLPDSACNGATHLARHRGKLVGTCTRYYDDGSVVGVFVVWNGAVWVAEKPKAARGGALGAPVPARDGGLWFAGTDAKGKGALLHRSASGAWSRTAISPEPLSGASYDSAGHMAALPGTSSLLRAGHTEDDMGDPTGALVRLDLP
ncbi:hypothetical protein EDD29_2374 [Actinocorallia herbida]|uniref:Tachylectin n=1 Tax=Actinocorallia herbida TaxID=58109 RepID=A0A3N1CUE2_9ACTN|nr:hypothetical protein [Actinocorallia herbida]ROO84845.1 hypothetical protein EDD29_2374 [Actinocorallia herbida]